MTREGRGPEKGENTTPAGRAKIHDELARALEDESGPPPVKRLRTPQTSPARMVPVPPPAPGYELDPRIAEAIANAVEQGIGGMVANLPRAEDFDPPAGELIEETHRRFDTLDSRADDLAAFRLQLYDDVQSRLGQLDRQAAELADFRGLNDDVQERIGQLDVVAAELAAFRRELTDDVERFGQLDAQLAGVLESVAKRVGAAEAKIWDVQKGIAADVDARVKEVEVQAEAAMRIADAAHAQVTRVLMGLRELHETLIAAEAGDTGGVLNDAVERLATRIANDEDFDPA